MEAAGAQESCGYMSIVHMRGLDKRFCWGIYWSLGWEGPLEKEMGTCSSILAWEVPQTERA